MLAPGSLRRNSLSIALVFAFFAVTACARAFAAHPKRAGTVTAISVKGLRVQPLQLAGGKRGWRVAIPGGRALATPAVVDDTVFVGGGFGSHEFYAFDAQTGAPRWGIRVSDDGPTAAVVAEGRVVFNTESCTLFVVDARTGKHLWSRWLGDPLMSQPAIADGIIYMAYPADDGQHHLIALGLQDGKQVFDRPIAGDIISAPVVDGDSVYLTTFDGTVYRHDRRSGQLAWQSKMNATSAPFIANGEIHVSETRNQALAGRPPSKTEGFRTLTPGGKPKGELKAHKQAPYLDSAVQASTRYATAQKSDDAQVGFGAGAPANAKSAAAAANIGPSNVRGLWEYQGSRPLILGDKSFSTHGDSVVGMEAASGRKLWEQKLSGDVTKVGGHLASPPAYAAGQLILGTTAGDVIGYEAATGKERLRFALGEEIRFQPALVGGRIFVGTARGTLAAITTGDPNLDGWTMWGGGPRHNGPESRALAAGGK